MFDFGLLFIAGLCQLALGILGLRLSTRRTNKAQKTRYEWGFILIGLIGLGTIVWSGIRSVNVQSAIADGVEKIEVKLGITKSDGSNGEMQTLDQTVQVECQREHLPKIFPINGKVPVVNFWSHESAGQGLGEYGGVPGTPMQWDEQLTLRSWGCTVTNYSKTSIFNITVQLKVSWVQAIKNESGGVSSGAVIKTENWPVFVSHLDAGNQNSYQLFLSNIGPEFVLINLPEEATLQRLGSSDFQTVKLMPSRLSGFYVPPGPPQQ